MHTATKKSPVCNAVSAPSRAPRVLTMTDSASRVRERRTDLGVIALRDSSPTGS